MGRRIAPEYAVITVHAAEAQATGIAFYDRKALYLSEAIPTEFIEVGEIHTDGRRREDRRGFGGRGHGRGSRRSGRHDRDRGRDRDRDRDRGSEGRGGRRPAAERRERGPDDSRASERPPARREPEPRTTPAAPAKAEPATSSEGFGVGIYEQPSKGSARKAEPAVAEKPEAPEAPEPPRESPAEPVVERADEPSSGPVRGRHRLTRPPRPTLPAPARG